MTDSATIDRLPTLAERFRRGDREAFQELYRSIDGDLRAFVFARSRRGVDRESLVQTVWVRAWTARERYEDQSFRGWIFEIARHLVIDAYRRQGGRPVHESWSDREFVDRALDPEDDRLEALKDCLGRVGGEFVRVLQLRIEGLTTEEIAARMSIAENSVFSRASRGRQELRDCIERKGT